MSLRTYRSPRRSLPSFDFDSALRDMEARRRNTPLGQAEAKIAEMVDVLKQSRSALVTAYHDIADETAKRVINRRIDAINAVLVKVEGRA